MIEHSDGGGPYLRIYVDGRYVVLIDDNNVTRYINHMKDSSAVDGRVARQIERRARKYADEHDL